MKSLTNIYTIMYTNIYTIMHHNIYYLVHNFEIFSEPVKIDICKAYITKQYFTLILSYSNLTREILISCLEDLNNYENYNKKNMLKFANENNKSIILEVFNKLEIFK